tara:strand:+ start:2873 stop:3514 length:642 start_codon:yes stop_codon:yes gene_type:complete
MCMGDSIEVGGVVYTAPPPTEEVQVVQPNPHVDNIDWNYIKEQEGFETTGYVPKNKDGTAMGHSGVTVASGFDLGSRTVESLEGLDPSIIEKLTPFLGLQGDAAINKAAELALTEEDANAIDEWAKKDVLKGLRQAWEEDTGNSWDDLPKNQATAVADLVFNHGLSATRSYNFWDQVTSGDWEGAEANLRNFGSANQSLQDRRTRAADYLKGK